MSTATLGLSTSFPEARTETRKGFLLRFFDAIAAARMRAAMREIERHRHLLPDHLLKQARIEPTLTNDGALPFTR